MRIGIDARMYGPKQGGLGRYVQQLIEHLNPSSFAAGELRRASMETWKHENTDTEFVVFLRKENWSDFNPTSPKFKKVLADVPWYGWKEQLLMPGIIKREKVDLMHFPHWNVPFFYNKPFVVTIHDLILLHYPTRRASTLGPITYWLKNIAYKAVLRHATTRARAILTPSEFVKTDIINTLKVSAEKITVTYLGITDNMDTKYLIHNTKYIIPNTKYHITKPYLLYVGVAYPHKNLEGLLNAWNKFCVQHGHDYQLVLAGKKNYFYQRLINLPIFQSSNHSIIYTNFVPDADLPALYQNAALYVFPSFYEGFGLPPLEAMQYSLPVISSNRSCLPEILQDAALYFDPADQQQISDAIWRGLTDNSLRTKLVQAGQKVIHTYSWKNTAKLTWEVYKKMV